MIVVADAHTHPAAAFQSSSDKENPMVARSGHIAIIIPNFAWPHVQQRSMRIEYSGEHAWIDRSPNTNPGFLYTGIWS